MTKQIATFSALVVAAVAGIAYMAFTPEHTTNASTAATVAGKHYDQPPEMKIDVNKSYTAKLETSKGDIVLNLYPKEAPKTVNNFVFLIRDGFYDGVVFHRVIPDFMAQGGDPTGTGRGGPGYEFEDETDPAKNPHKFDKPGILAMANAGPNTNGSQFFITYKETPWLDGHHTIFGQIADEKSQAVLNKLVNGDTIKKATVEEK
jgi:peptidyl-prolyl cis-trans isomerase B (cyclophilin B)